MKNALHPEQAQDKVLAPEAYAQALNPLIGETQKGCVLGG